MLVVSVLLLQVLSYAAHASERHYEFRVDYMNVSRLGVTKPLVAVNNLFPGPTVYANEDDRLLIKVTNNVEYGVTIHWHGVRQIRSAWSDGPSYITQCPLWKGQSYLYNFTLQGQRGTLFWHAHATWLRATVYGAIVIYPNYGLPYPFKFPFEEHILLLGEWWNMNVEEIEAGMEMGLRPVVSDAYTINGLPGPLYNNSASDVYKLEVQAGKTYLLRIVNAALNQELFFSIARHRMQLVEVDGAYSEPYDTDTILVAPGQTANVLVTADQTPGKYAMSAGPFMSVSPAIPYGETPATAVLRYKTSNLGSPVVKAYLPSATNNVYAESLADAVRSLSKQTVPITVDKSFFFTIGFGIIDCGPKANATTCGTGTQLGSTINNISFVLPSTSILEAYYHRIPGVYSTDFPAYPSPTFDYTEPRSSASNRASRGTKISVIPFNSNVQIVLQDTSAVAFENHPIHLHGYSFYIVGRGLGNFDPFTANLNLLNPPYRNTVAVPSGGWAAIRFKADNPGVWFMHCHLESHTTWGLATALLVTNGVGVNETLPPPPPDFPKCTKKI